MIALWGVREEYDTRSLEYAAAVMGPIADWVQGEIRYSSLIHQIPAWNREIEAFIERINTLQRMKKMEQIIIDQIDQEIARMTAERDAYQARLKDLEDN